MKTYTLFKEYTWLVNTIHQAGRITLAEINRRWLLTEMSEGVEIARSTFFRHKCAIEDIFGIYIECDKKNGNKYYIGNEHVLREDTVQNWMLSTLSVGNMVSESQSLHQRILLEHVPSGGERLRKVIKAMKENCQLHITYRRYSASASKDFTIDPYCMKLFRQRWYLLGRLTNGYLSTFSLDRVEDIKQLDSKFIVPDDFDGAAYFQDSFGMLTDDKMAVERGFGFECDVYLSKDGRVESVDTVSLVRILSAPVAHLKRTVGAAALCYQSVASASLVVREQVIGLLAVGSCHQRNVWRKEHVGCPC